MLNLAAIPASLRSQIRASGEAWAVQRRLGNLHKTLSPLRISPVAHRSNFGSLQAGALFSYLAGQKFLNPRSGQC
jgi:hypothetical protein